MDALTAAVGNPRNNDMSPSRVSKGTGEGNQPQSAPTTRPDQLGGK